MSTRTEKIDVGKGWVLLKDGERVREGDGFWHPDYRMWISFECRPDIFRGKSIFRGRQLVHSGWLWRRRKIREPKRRVARRKK